mmetsp:Transcript_4047/g.8481  ORF Transcript_4047/g.8481 Transcript_4047/m.8481 type:complete len:90 (-) Transcript_4047:119-388(-)
MDLVWILPTENSAKQPYICSLRSCSLRSEAEAHVVTSHNKGKVCSTSGAMSASGERNIQIRQLCQGEMPHVLGSADDANGNLAIERRTR